MSKRLAILGAGELGKQIANFALNDNHYTEVYFYDDFFSNDEIVGNSDKMVEDYSKNLFDELIIGIGYNHLVAREEKFKAFKNSIPFGKIVHSSCWTDPSAVIEEGCVLYPRSVVDKNVKISYNTIINLNCTIAHDTTIGSSCFLAPAVAIAGFCTIKAACFIGINTTIKDNLIIDDNVVIGAGSLVIRSILKKGTYFGNPIKN